jgi:twitching motility two-component system response regulator PilH
MSIKTILLVEDSATDQQFLRDLLLPQGYEVISASGNGFQATRQLAEDESTRDIPVIICTSKSQETDRIWGLKQGAKDFVVKPIDGTELLTKIAAQG